ncbi:polyamine aminopropyltransferase [Desulfovibrio mangrovi]|uniref:polyamine aminopropyltransferase n=1 Tax=Desulfovibrio mangrovi TaxID=2976983 RepID=UPI0022472B75|nr:polyamine aminopropyltransferase [Desulfovibrio mangrovi]UZP65830.1 polyamine aminopropyltransferase [Desulfovibrio mangrovi]
MNSIRRFSLILKASVFATGLAGIVAEYVLSTLATYLLGNAVFQWTITMSLMLFAMGLGSRISKSFRWNLLDLFIAVEFLLSVLCASASVLAYGLAAYTSNIGLVIYALAVAIGLLIGFEIPLVTRINEDYEELRTNIANVMEKDYYGALVGGLLFAFIALPYLGLTYTPIALGAINFAVASLFLWSFRHLLYRSRIAIGGFFVVTAYLVALAISAKPIILFGEQSRYKDKIVYEEQSIYQKLVITQWKNYHWLFINGQEQFSTYDEERYHEPLVHPAMQLATSHERILILGGGDGLAVRELLKYKDIGSITLVDLDPAMPRLAKTHPVLLAANGNSLADPRVTVVHEDAGTFLLNSADLFDVVIIDLPDPDSVDLMHLYSLDFYQTLRHHLSADGVVVTQAGSPYFATMAFLCIDRTMRAAGLVTLPYHNQVPTMGEWGWVLAMRAGTHGTTGMRERLERAGLDGIPTRFLNEEAMQAMFKFGKGVFDHPKAGDVEVNTRHKPVLYRYYKDARWDVY